MSDREPGESVADEDRRPVQVVADEDREPVQAAAAGERDLYDVATWEVRTPLDRLAAAIYGLLVVAGKGLLVLVATALLVVQFVLGGLSSTVLDPVFLTLVVLSIVPALLLAAYVRHADVTRSQPLGSLAVTFVLGVLLATFAAVVNTLLVGAFSPLGVLAMPVFFFLVVGPVEEIVKLSAVRLYAYRDEAFTSVVDGAVYGAVAGLGFATIENLLYISRSVDGGNAMVLGVAGGTAAVRALAGPGHVIYSALAGYYLGLAKFNPGNRGPIVVKGLVLAAFVHATYNTLVGFAPGALNATVAPVGEVAWFVVFVIVYDGVVGYAVYRKLKRYDEVFRAVT